MRVALNRCRNGSPAVTCSAPGILLQDARVADWEPLVSRKDSRLLRVPPPAPHDRESSGSTVGGASRQEAPSASAGNAPFTSPRSALPTRLSPAFPSLALRAS